MSKRTQRLSRLLWPLLGLALAGGFILYSIRTHVDLFFTPTQMTHATLTPTQRIRLGGLVERGSLKHLQGLAIAFRVRDQHTSLHVDYDGTVPDLFREGQSVVMDGYPLSATHFHATRILAKHDERYMPANIKKALSQPSKVQ